MTRRHPAKGFTTAGRDGAMIWLLRAEWTKFRTVRGWVAGMLGAAVVFVALGVLTAASSHTTCGAGAVEVACPVPPLGPEGGAVDDTFLFAHRALTGDGAITARLTGMTGVITYPPPDHDEIVPGLVPWAKAGVIVKADTRPGSSYAALMLTGKHGVHLQHDFTHDTAGRPGGVSAASPRWLRLVRAGGTITGYESTDGTRWTKVGTVRPARLPGTVRVGLFVASPGDLTVKPGGVSQVRFTQTTGVFDNVTTQGAAGAWRHEEVGGDEAMTDWERYHRPAGVREAAGTLTVTGSGDIAPKTDGRRIEQTLAGLLPALMLVIVVATLFTTTEYRRGLIRATLLTTPSRTRTLAAKTAVLAAVTFTCALAATAVTMPLATRVLHAGGNILLPVPALTELRVTLGMATAFALAATLVAALGTLYRRAAPTVTTAFALLVLPYILSVVLPDTPARLLLTLTPAAAFAVQQTAPEYPQVTAYYAPSGGYFPLPPWAGLTVLVAWTAAALVTAALLLDRRDA
ncbi:ABC transporter permease subunit [Sphaerisporangium sp. B11E5]|uniref:ABC transporter permease subunit n=1 Tax=Sphaerisporangium sp. B11E5 TaxID=3153563 RepID=UPI00325F8E69